MSRWRPTKYEGVYLDTLAKSRGADAKFVFKVRWRNLQVMRGGFVSATKARDERMKTKVKLIENEGRLPYRRLPADSFKKMVEALVRKRDIRKSASQTGRPRYSILYNDGKDYSLFDLCFRYLTESKRHHFNDGVGLVNFAAWLRKSGRSERTLEMAFRLLNKVYGLAAVRGLYPHNPVREAKQSEVLAYQIKKRGGHARKYPAMRRTITPEEKQKICEAVKRWRDPRAVWVGLNIWTGLRPSVFNRIRFEDFDPAAGILYIQPEAHKSRFFREAGKPSASILRRETYPLLQHYAARIGICFDRAVAPDTSLYPATLPPSGRSGFVDSSGNKITGPFFRAPLLRSSMRRQWRLILRSAAVEYAAPYAARHTVINELLSSEIPVQDVATHSGNSPETIFRYYVRPSSDADIRRAAIKWQERQAAVS